MSDRVSDAVWAALAGHSLGSTQTGARGFKRLAFYEPGPLRMPPSPVFEAWLVFARYLSTGEGPEGLWRESLDAWTYATEAAAFGRANMRRGLPVPASGRCGNPFREDSSALGRAVFWGLVHPGRPEVAANWAFWDASFDHAGEAVWTAMSAAACVSACRPGSVLSDVLRATADALPRDSQANPLLAAVIQSLGETDPLPGLKPRWEGELAAKPSGHALFAFAHGLAALSVAKDPASAVTGAAGFGGSADQACLFAGAGAACLFGPIAPEWAGPLGEAFVCGHGLRGLEPPETLAEFAAIIAAAVRSEETSDAWKPSAGAGAAALSEGLKLEAAFPDGPVDRGESGWQTALTLTNMSAVEAETECRVQPPIDAEIATRIGTESLAPGQSVTKGLVVKRTAGAPDAFVTVNAGPVTLRLPVLQPQLWFAAGPFDNERQDAFETVLPAEGGASASDGFNGRSGLLVRWERWPQFGRVLDVEPLFQLGPGAVVLWARFRLEVQGPVKVVAAGAPGVTVKVDGETLVRYKDTHVPSPGLKQPYLAEFTPGAETTIVVKLVRDRQPAFPFVLYFVDQEGTVVDPSGWSQVLT